MTSCSSSTSAQRSIKSDDHRSRSCDTVCTSNSSCFLQRRKPMNPLMYPVRPSYTKSSGNTVRQRVLSAKLLKLRSLQNQLNDANFHLVEIAKENQTLKNLQKRQDKALSKYEGMNEDLPRLIHSHEEQLRVLTETNKSLKKNIRELNETLKTKDEELIKMQEKLTHLERLNRDKHLMDREKLMDQLEDLKVKLQKSDEQTAFLNRKLMLESKTSKQRVNAEMVKHKQCQRELEKAIAEIERLTSLLEAKENVVHPRKNRFSRQSLSITDIKLEPIKCKIEDTSKKVNGILNMPSENIKNRLSSGSTRSRESTDSCSSNNVKAQSSGSEISLDMCDTSASTSETNRLSSTYNFENVTSPEDDIKGIGQSESSTNLEELTKSLDAAVQKAVLNANDDFEKNLGDHCSNIMTNIRNNSVRVDAQKESIKIAQEDTITLLETFKKTKRVEAKLKNSLLNIEDDNIEFINEILSEELKFQMTNKDNKPVDKNANVREPKVNLEDKKKLLAALKAIDNGDNIDSVGNSPSHKQTNLMKEIFGDVLK